MSCNQKQTILIVDDNPNNLQVLSKILSVKGYEVKKSISGLFALQALPIVKPELIFLDINMPDMDGYDVCAKLKSEPDTARIPVIFISAYDDVQNKAKAFQVGGVDYITKPFQEEEVLARTKNQLAVNWLQNKLDEQNRRMHELQQRADRLATKLEALGIDPNTI